MCRPIGNVVTSYGCPALTLIFGEPEPTGANQRRKRLTEPRGAHLKANEGMASSKSHGASDARAADPDVNDHSRPRRHEGVKHSRHQLWRLELPLRWKTGNREHASRPILERVPANAKAAVDIEALMRSKRRLRVLRIALEAVHPNAVVPGRGRRCGSSGSARDIDEGRAAAREDDQPPTVLEHPPHLRKEKPPLLRGPRPIPAPMTAVGARGRIDDNQVHGAVRQPRNQLKATAPDHRATLRVSGPAVSSKAGEDVPINRREGPLRRRQQRGSVATTRGKTSGHGDQGRGVGSSRPRRRQANTAVGKHASHSCGEHPLRQVRRSVEPSKHILRRAPLGTARHCELRGEP